jgi:hypothetical protein
VATSRLAKIFKDPLRLRLVTGHKDLKTLARYFHKTARELAEEAGLVAIAQPEQGVPESGERADARRAQPGKAAA